METLEQRFWAKVEKTDNCWNWTASKSTKGYGRIGVGRRPKFAHRVSWEIHNGPVPEGLCVLHHCDNPACVNPRHLWLGTDMDNAHDRDRKGRLRSSNAAKTSCWRGHPFTIANTYIESNGSRKCRTCCRQNRRERRMSA